MPESHRTKPKALLFLGVLLSVLTACAPLTPTPQPPTPHLTYEVSGCAKGFALDRIQEWEGTETTVEGGAVVIHDRVAYVCCATLTVKMQQEDKVIKVAERNVGEVCRCMCGYVVNARITNLPAGTYVVQVWGIEHEQTGPAELRAQTRVTIP